MLASLPTRHQQLSHHSQSSTSPSYSQYWSSPSSTSTTSRSSTSNSLPQSVTTTNNVFSFGHDPSLFDYDTNYVLSHPQPLMPSEHTNNSWFEADQLTPTSTTKKHRREASFSSLGSAGPASPYTANTSNPQIVGDTYHEFPEYAHFSSKPLTPAPTPIQEQHITPHYSTYYNNGYTMAANDGLSKHSAQATYNHSVGPTIVANSSPATPMKEEHNGYSAPKLIRTFTDAAQDELYIPDYPTTSAPTSSSMPAPSQMSSQNDVLQQMIQNATNQHLSAQTPLTIPSRRKSPFRQGSPLAPTLNSFESQNNNYPLSARVKQEQQDYINRNTDAVNGVKQMNSTESKTISPKDVDLVYNESEDDANTPLFPPSSQQSQQSASSYRQQPLLSPEAQEPDDASQQSYGSMATTRRESSSAFSTISQIGQQPSGYNFTAPSTNGRKIPQQYPFVPQTRRQPTNVSSASAEDFPSTLRSMESSSSEYADSSEIRRPATTTADTGTYTCTYHGCTLRFDSPAKLQRHKREGHRNPAVISSGSDAGMTSAALRNSQAGPHKCERINPSTGKPCDTIFSRPYDLTRHEDTIHNARKQKVHCPYCTEEKTFSRNDALTRHLRVVHPERVDHTRKRRNAAHD